MREVVVNERSTLRADTFHKFLSNSPAGGWFPALQGLTWTITRSNLPYTNLFFSPHLKKAFIYLSWWWYGPDVPYDLLPTIASTISTLPTSTIQLLRAGVDNRRGSWEYLKESLSSVVLGCGPSLTELNSPIPMSDAAINHLIRLPNFRTWNTEGPPPSYSALSLPLLFSPLTELTLGDSAACGWLPLFKRLEHSTSIARAVTPLSRMKESLTLLSIENLDGSIIDVALATTIQIFRNLITLYVEYYCYAPGEEGECTFKLNNDSVAELATALPQIESLLLGYPCAENTCATTVACLVPISACCVKLQTLEIHFNTTNIVEDLKNISEDPRYQALRSLPRCTLARLGVYHLPLALDEPGFETVAHGMIDIFPSLDHCAGRAGNWGKLSDKIVKVQDL